MSSSDAAAAHTACADEVVFGGMGAAANEIGRNEPTDERVAAALCNLLLTCLALEYRAPAAWIDMSYAALSRPMSKHDSESKRTHLGNFASNTHR